MKNLKEIRTPETNKLYGILNLHTYTLSIKEGKITRIIPIPKDGITLQLICGDTFEEIVIPPKKLLIQA